MPIDMVKNSCLDLFFERAAHVICTRHHGKVKRRRSPLTSDTL